MSMSYTHLGFFGNTTINRIVPISFVLPKKAKSSAATYAVAACRLPPATCCLLPASIFVKNFADVNEA